LLLAPLIDGRDLKEDEVAIESAVASSPLPLTPSRWEGGFCLEFSVSLRPCPSAMPYPPGSALSSPGATMKKNLNMQYL